MPCIRMSAISDNRFGCRLPLDWSRQLEIEAPYQCAEWSMEISFGLLNLLISKWSGTGEVWSSESFLFPLPSQFMQVHTASTIYLYVTFILYSWPLTNDTRMGYRVNCHLSSRYAVTRFSQSPTKFFRYLGGCKPTLNKISHSLVLAFGS